MTFGVVNGSGRRFGRSLKVRDPQTGRRATVRYALDRHGRRVCTITVLRSVPCR